MIFSLNPLHSPLGDAPREALTEYEPDRPRTLADISVAEMAHPNPTVTSGFPYTDRVLLFVTVVTHTEGFHACGGCEGDFGVTSALGLGGLFPFMVSETRLAPDV